MPHARPFRLRPLVDQETQHRATLRRTLVKLCLSDVAYEGAHRPCRSPVRQGCEAESYTQPHALRSPPRTSRSLAAETVRRHPHHQRIRRARPTTDSELWKAAFPAGERARTPFRSTTARI